jgi:copper chaperone CopZ
MKKLIAIPIVSAVLLLILTISCNSTGGNTDKQAMSGPVNRIEVSIKGMTCTGCEQTIQTSVAKLDGVKSVKANFTTGKAFVDYVPGLVDTSMIKTAIAQKGYFVTGFNPVAATDTVQ